MKRKPARPTITTIEMIDHPWITPITMHTSTGKPYPWHVLHFPVVIDGRKHNATSASRSRLGQVITNAIVAGLDVEYSNPFPHKHTIAKITRPAKG